MSSLVNEDDLPDVYPLVLPVLEYPRPRKCDLQSALPTHGDPKLTHLVAELQRLRDHLGTTLAKEAPAADVIIAVNDYLPVFVAVRDAASVMQCVGRVARGVSHKQRGATSLTHAFAIVSRWPITACHSLCVSSYT